MFRESRWVARSCHHITGWPVVVTWFEQSNFAAIYTGAPRNRRESQATLHAMQGMFSYLTVLCTHKIALLLQTEA
jgi:hypothetical protein